MKIKYLVLLALVASCAPTIGKDFDKYQKQFLQKSKYLPNEESLAGKASKIVVFNLDENDNQVATQAGLGTTMANNVENILTKNRLAQLVDRKSAAKLQKEIALAELNKTGSYKGPQVADYAISGAISNAGFTSKFVQGGTSYDPKTRSMTTVPSRFVYKSEVSGNIKIYELPSMAVVDNVEFQGEKARTENVQENGGLSFGALKIGGQQSKGADRDDALVRKAGEDAIDNASVAIKNLLAQKGYILEKRILEKKTIFKISIGSMQGLTHGDKFEVSGQFDSENAITGKVEVERRIIAEGTVTEKIDPKTAWVVLDDQDKNSQVRLGDVVKMKYKKNYFAVAAKMAGSVMDQQ